MTAGSGALRKITAIIRNDRVDDLEKQLRRSGVPGVSVDDVKGYGEYPDLICSDWLSRHTRVEIVVDESQVPRIADMIIEAAHTGLPGDGIVYVEPVTAVYRIRDRHHAKSA